RVLGGAKMPVTTKLECAHCGSRLKTKKIVLPGTKVKCPHCNGVFHVLGSDGEGLIETIPVEGEEAAFDLDAPTSDEGVKAIVLNNPAPKSRATDRIESGSPLRIAPSDGAASKKLDISEPSVPFRGSRAFVAGFGITAGVLLIVAFVWWYVGQVR